MFCLKYVREAKHKDMGQVCAFYEEGKLDIEVKEDEIQNKFLLIDDDKNLFGVMGYEGKGPHALLKECVISPQVSSVELYAYFQGVVGYLKQKGYEKIYIYTPNPSMRTLFLQLDFQEVEREIRACTPNFWKTKLEVNAEGLWFFCG